MHSLVTIALSAVVVLCFVNSADAAVPNFQKMKVKQIKQWMSARSLSCPECTDKSQLIQFCIEAAKNEPAAPVLPGIPEGKPFWDVWADIAETSCKTYATENKIDAATSDDVCPTIHHALSSLFMQQGKRTASILKKNTDAMLRTSFGEIYYSAGTRIISRMIKQCFKSEAAIKKCSSAGGLQKLMENNKIKDANFVEYITNVGVENTNPMYAILTDKNADK
eukprot:Tbor_TRINITY_DN1955_c1_g1::TRINITY_DN1955_c1_g1_i1::g.3499::m.3499